MAETRGESRASYVSQSQYSESTIINQDITDNELFNPPEHGHKTSIQPNKQVQFAPTLSRSHTLDQISDQSKKGLFKSKQLDLMERLVARPHKAQVFQAVNPSPRRQEAQSPIENGPKVPRPPSGKAGPIGSFRTTMFKRDYEKRQTDLKIKIHGTTGEPPKLTVGMLHKPKVVEAPAHVNQVEDNPYDSEEMQVLRELVELMGPESTQAESKSGIDNEDMFLDEDKSALRSKSEPETVITQPSVKTTTMETVDSSEWDAEAENDIDVCKVKYNDGIPIIEKIARTPPAEEEKEEERAAPSTAVASKYLDKDRVLSYKKKNKYDDTVPENDDIVHNMTRLRERLGWPTEIPRYGPGCKEKLDAMKDPPEVGEQKMGGQTIKEDDGEFVYCLPRWRKDRRARYDPYDLQVVSSNTARAEQKYWTLTATYVTRHEEGEREAVSTPCLWWLWERRLFYMIYNLPVFVKYRLLKTYKIWMKNVRLQKSFRSKAVIYKSLFVANEVLQGCLIHVRRLCEAASGSLTGEGDGESAIALVTLDRSKTLTLGEFKEAQFQQGKIALKQLEALREKIIDIVWESCATVAEMEGITQGIRPEGSKRVMIKQPPKEEEKPKMTAQMKLRNKYGDIPTPESKKKEEVPKKPFKPLYAEISEWRKILARLARFLRSVDLLVQEMLRRMVVTAVRQVLDHLVSSYNVTDEDEEKYNQWYDEQLRKELASTYFDSTESSPEPDASGHMSRASVASRASKQRSAPPLAPSDQKGPKGEDDAAGDDESDFSRQNSRAESVMSGMSSRLGTSSPVKQPKAVEKYVIPHFDFDQPEIVEGPPDPDEILEEIKRRDIVEEVTAPVFSLQLVLNINKGESQLPHRNSFSETRGSGKSSIHRAFAVQEETVIGKKTVTFTDHHQEEEDTGSEYEDEESYEEDSEEETEESREKSRNRFAYEGSKKREKEDLGKACVSLSPNEYEFKRGIKDIIVNFELTVGKFVSMLREPRLKVFYSPPSMDLKLNIDEEEEKERLELRRPWPDLDFMFGDDPEYQDLLQELASYMSMEMELVKQYSINFDQFCVMVDQARKLNVHQSMKRREWSTDEFQHVLATYTEIIKAMKKMTVMRRVSMIQVQSRGFRDSCLPFPEAIIKETHIQLPLIANKRNEDLLTIIKGALKKLDHYPNSVEDFVEHLSFLGKMTTELPALDKEFAVVNKLFTIAKMYDVHIEAENYALYQFLPQSFQQLKSTVLYCEAKKDENIRKFSRDLDSLIYSIRHRLMDLKNRVQDPDLLHIDTMSVTALETIKDLQDEVKELSLKARSYASYQERFGSSLTSTKKGLFGEDYLMLLDKQDEKSAQELQSELNEIEHDIMLRRVLWQSQEEWSKLVDEWTTTVFDVLNVQTLQKNVNRFTQTVYMLDKGLPHNEVVPQLKERVLDFKQGMPVITSLRNPSLRRRHWEEIEKLIQKSIAKDKVFTLGNLLEMNIFRHKERIQEISTTASNEATLETMLQKIIDLWQSTDFRLVPHAGRDTFIIGGADDIMAQLEESQVTIGTIRDSRYVAPIRSQVEEWERKLQVFSRTLDEWMNCQRSWWYLEQIFSTPDIQRQLPNETQLFNTVDKSWKDIMRRVEDRPNALKSAITPGTLDILQTCNQNLEKIQRNLEEYLETKRSTFPRFYFLSNDELLFIMAQSKDPNAVQPHLGKCFGNIKSLNLQVSERAQQTALVLSMTSAEGETVNMPRNLRVRGGIEHWMVGVEGGMLETVKRHLKEGLADWSSKDLKRWVLRHPGQVILTVAQIMFNKDVVRCFDADNASNGLVNVKEKMVDWLNELARVVTSNLLSHQRSSIEALLTINVHNRDIVLTMIDDEVSQKDDFDWTRQLRYEWDEQSNNCLVLQSNASFQYGYEYLGCSSRLVITPLTDRCYLTLTGALHLHLGGSPAGPAGTGKTETVKDLAKAVGKQCVVFNCSEGLDYKTLGKFFSGLAQSGSWCCFDEFNRIDVEVLSVVAQQLLTIKTAKDAQSLRFMFEGKEIKLNMTCGYFVTMNPTYAGRVELPDNLKSLFRSVAMMVPNYGMIAEIMLFSEGFMAAKSLSRKIVNLYELASRQLSQQDHYDFGMRAIKSVLVMAGHRRHQTQLKEENIDRNLTEMEESYILIHSLRDANLPKFLAEDVPLFERILDDLFPGIIPPEPDHGILERAINMAIRDNNLQQWPSQMDKIKQLYNQILVRHGVMLVGPTGGGKTTARSILQKALVLMPTILQQENQSAVNQVRKQSLFGQSRTKKGHVEVFTINPKCVKLGELYGETDPNTFEWTDGLIATAIRKFAKETIQPHGDESRPTTAASGNSQVSAPPPSATTEQEEEKKEGPHNIDWRWLVLDGPVDTLWVENLNTVLDDSKVLCLPSGERINLSTGMRLIFEVDNLTQASPATISRCAMVYTDPVDLGWKPYVRTWVSKLPREMPESGKQHLVKLFEHSIDKGLRFVHNHRRFQMIYIPDMCLVSTLCSILSAFFDFMTKHGGFGNPAHFKEQEKRDKDDAATESSDRTDRAESQSSGQSSRATSRSGLRKKRKTRVSSVKSREDLDTIAELKAEKPSSNQSSRALYLQKNPQQLVNLLGKLFTFAFTWSIGGNFKRQEDVDDDDSVSRRGTDKSSTEIDMNICSEFDSFMHEVFDIEPPLGIRLPTGNRSIYSYFIDMESGNFVPWDVLVPQTKSLIEKGAVITIAETMGVQSEHRKKREETDITSTVDIVRFSFLTGLLLLNKNPVLLTGDSGVGKSAIINYMLKQMKLEGGTEPKSGTILGNVFCYSDKHSSLLENISNLTKFGQDESKQHIDLLLGGGKPKHSTGLISTMIQFSAQTTAARLQAHIIHKLIKKGKDTLGAPKGRKCIVFVDDLNMPAPEEYGAQPPLELLRQFLEHSGFYDTKTLVWKDIFDVNIVSACGPPGGGRNPVSPRLLKHFCVFALPQPSTRSLQHIYQVQLGRFFQEGDFAQEFTELLFQLVSASIAVYYRMCSSMLPTPAKSHYTFNLRDLSKVIQGLLQANETVIVSRDNAAQLFAHEATRVFHDRLICPEDREYFYAFLADNLHDYFKVNWTKEQLMNEEVLFGDFFEGEGHARIYRSMSDRTKLGQVLEEFYMRMNYGNTRAVQHNQDIDSRANQMVFFKGAVEHITRAARVFRQPGGHMVLVGLDGTGKATTVQLASHIAQCKLFKLTLHKGYGNAEFREDLKKVFRSTGVKNHKIVFLLTDSDIVKESFLEDVNCILNSGEVPDLFDNEERDGIIVDMKHDAAQADIPDTRDAMYQFFLSRVKRNLHMVLTMSPAGGKFRQRCRMNPALINCCTIDWYDTWNDEAMLSVADVFFLNSEFIADEACDLEALKHKVGRMCVDIHKSVDKMAVRYWDEMRRYYYSTPSSYMELIRLYAKMLQENKADFLRSKNRLLGGLQKLSEANSAVGTMRDELESLGPKIVEKQQETEVLLQQLEKDKEAGEQVRKIVEEEEEIMQKETQIVQDYADECEKDLASALPALQNAIEALETLDKASISEIRVYTKPPVLVMTVMSAVCVLFQKKTDWATAKQMLGDQSFLKKLTNFDKSTVPDKVFHRLKKFSKLPEFNPEVVGNVSLACKSICMWVKAIEHYHEVYKMVKPKQRRVSEAKEALLMAQESLSQKQASLRKLQDHLDMLEKQYHDSVNERESLKQRKVTTGLRLKRASVLIDALVNEKVRWAESVKELDGKLQGIVGDTLIATAAVVYMGPFTSKYRKLLIGSWVDDCREVNIPITKEFDLVKNTVSAHQVLKWQNEGLPTDNHSTENALFVKKAHKWPLFIDPQGQAFNYIREMEGSRLNIVAASDQNYMRSLETAISVGQPMLIKDVDETLDPALRPVLLHETFQRGGHLVIKLGETEIEYNENFKLYMTTSMANPHYLPAVYIQVNIINFTVTFEGLQEQLLSIVVKQEKPKLESQRSELLESIANDLHNLTAQEDKSLSLLHASGSSLLDDQDLVDTLHSSKGKAEEIYKRVEKSEETEKKLSQARKKYLPVATRGVTIYFVLADLAGIDVMYQFSLEWFQDMFTSCIGGAPSDISRRKFSSVSHVSGVIRPSSRGGLTPRGSMDLGDAKGSSESMNPSQLRKHMLDMINRLTTNIYRVVSVALFSNHQLIFSYMLCTSIMRTNSRYEDITTVGKIEEFDWQVFLHGNIMANMMDEKMLKEHDGLTSIERLEGENNPEKKRQPPKWIDSIRWKQCQHMDATIPAFHNLCRSIMTNKSQWKVFYANEEPYKLMEKPFNINDAKLPAGEKETGVTFEWHKLEKFHHLILLKVLRPETLIASITLFVQDQMDASYLSTGTFDLKEIYEESTAKTPLIFILSPGCDPAAQLLRFAKELRGSTLHLDMISLGRGQGPRAEELIKKAQILKGRWVFLQNCHLAASWMPNLQALMEKFSSSTDDLDKDFRLWLSSKPDPCFPISILQHGMKMTVEPPQGLKANMLRAFGSGGTGVVTEKKFEETDYGPLWKRLLFGLCLFNSVLHERKKYGRLGWNIAYEFNDSDLEVSMLQLQILLMEHDYIPWQAVTYLTGEVIYGGRVTDNWDHRCLRALLGRFFCEDVLSDSYSYSPDGIYKPIKNNSSFSNVVSYLESLPNYDSPELFGMTENAEKACLELKAFDIIETIITVQPRISLELMGAEKSNDEVVLEIAGDIINRLPFTVDDSHEYTPPLQSQMIPRPTLRNILFGEAVDLKDKDKEQVVKDAIKQVVGNSALMTVLRQEVDRFNNLLHIIHSSMKNLSKAVKGMIIMSEPLEDAYNALLSQKIPKRWTIAAYESCKPLGSWVQDLILRVDFFSEWGQLIVNNVEKIIKSVLMTKQKAPGADLDIESLRSLPRAFWLSGFIFPQGFLTAVQQNHARKLGISVDSLMFNYRVVKKGSDTNEMLGDLFQKLCIHDVAFTGNSPPEDGVIVFGLFLDGARWDMDTESLQDSIPGTRFSHLPEVHFEPRQISQMAEDKVSGNGSNKYLYECPLYRTSARAGTLSSTGHSTNFVTAVNLPSDHPSDFWVMRGVALLCQLDN